MIEQRREEISVESMKEDVESKECNHEIDTILCQKAVLTYTKKHVICKHHEKKTESSEEQYVGKSRMVGIERN